ncbi:MAG: 2-isopropylmalate synthase [Desulfovibrio sp.]|jgi:2-isopropylmalate synthase|nr:2-isopropylmalate synthase [Desulfovibrio sp.]
MPLADPDTIVIFDTTLRDGEQSPGATMSLAEKIRMAQQLEQLGVDVLEAGFAASSLGDFEAIAAIAEEIEHTRVCSLARANIADIDRAAESLLRAKKSRIHVFIATSPLHMAYKLGKKPDEVLRMIESSITHAAACSGDVEFSCEDASRSDPDFMLQACKTAVACGARTLNIPDTVGYAQPEEFAARIAYVRERIDPNVVISVHCHNDLGLAVANTLAAFRAGARQAEVTICGIGERAGNAALEEVIMALTVRRPYYRLSHAIKTEQIYPTARRLSRIIGQPLARNKPVVGANAFAHESGIHQAGVLKNPETYEIMTPASIGLPNNAIVMGKHSGKNAVKAKLESMGYHLDGAQIDMVLASVKRLADKKKEIYDEDLEALVLEEIYRIPDKYALIHLGVQSGDTGLPPTAVLVLDVDGKRVQHACFGVGPVDAVFQAIACVTKHKPKLEQYSVNSITGGTDALGEVTVRISENGNSAIGRGSDPDIINASARAYVNALNRLSKKQEEV